MKWHCNQINIPAEYSKYEFVETHTSDDSELSPKTKNPPMKKRVPIVLKNLRKKTVRVLKNKPCDDCFQTEHLNKSEETLFNCYKLDN